MVPALRCCAWRCGRRALGRAAQRWMRRRRCRSSAARAWLGPAADRRAFGGGPEPPGADARSARRDAGNTELAALPAVVEWPKLKSL